MNHDTLVDHNLMALSARVEHVRQLEQRYVRLSIPDIEPFHREMRYVGLLSSDERIQLMKIFPELLSQSPNAREDQPELAFAWDRKARAFLGHFMEFVRRAEQEQSWSLQARIEMDAPFGAVALTQSGSLLMLGPPNGDGARQFSYESIYNEALEANRGCSHLLRPLMLNRSALVGTLQSSVIMALASTPAEIGRPQYRYSQPIPENVRGSEKPAATGTRLWEIGLRRFHTLSARLGQRNISSEQRSLLECELRGLALFIQSQLTSLEHAPRLNAVSDFETGSGTRYALVSQRRALHLDRHVGGAVERFHNISIGAQRVVIGAPLVFIRQSDAAPDGRIVCCTGPLRRYTRCS